MSEPKTELIDTQSIQQEKQPRPPREMSQAAIACFFYGTLQLLVTVIGAGLTLTLAQVMKSLQSMVPTELNGATDSAELSELQKAAEELGITDPSLTTAPPLTGATPDVSAIPGLTGFTPEFTPSQIVPLELLAVIVTQGFGLLGLITAFISFGAAKGKSGRGLAITGFLSSFLSFVIAFMVALTV